jgi:hypothetical protein
MGRNTKRLVTNDSKSVECLILGVDGNIDDEDKESSMRKGAL